MNDYTLSNYQIDNLLSNEKGYRGTFMRNTLPKQINKHEISIVNLDSIKGPGTHWVLIYNNSNDPKHIYYFDSFGIIPPNEVIKYMRTANKKIQYNSSQLQNIQSSMCGYFDIFMAKEMNKGRSFYDSLYILSQIDSNKNDQFLRNYFHV